MDALDGNLHASLLAALASNLTSTSSHNQLTHLLQHPVDNLTASHGSDHGYSGHAASTRSDQPLTWQDVESVIAFASFAASTPRADNHDQLAHKLLSLLKRFPTWTVEPALGQQATQPYPPASRLAFALFTSALNLASTRSSARPSLLTALSTTHASLLSQLSSADPARVITFLLPALEGISRAWSALNTHLALDGQDLLAVLTVGLPEEGLADRVSTALLLPWNAEDHEGRSVLAVLDLYASAVSSSLSQGQGEVDEMAQGISPHTPVLSVLSAKEAAWASLLLSPFSSSPSSASATDLPRWTTLLSRPLLNLPTLLNNIGSQTVNELASAMRVWQDTLNKLDQSEKGSKTEREIDDQDRVGWQRAREVEVEGAEGVLRGALRLATLLALLLPSSSSESRASPLLSILRSLLNPEITPSVSPGLQILALQALQLLGAKSRELNAAAGETIKEFVLGDARAEGQEEEEDNREVGEAVVKTWSSLINASPESVHSRPATSQMLLNSLGGSTAGDRVKTRAVRVAGGLVREWGEVELVRLILPILSSQLASLSSSSSSSSLYIALLETLTSLGPYCPDSNTYTNLIRTVASSASTDGDNEIDDGGSARWNATIEALGRLVGSVKSRREVGGERGGEEGEEAVGEVWVKEVLGIWGRVAVAGSGSGSERSNKLLSLVPVLASYLHQTSSTASTEYTSSSTYALFRSFWFSCLLNGFLTPPSSASNSTATATRLNEYQQDALREVALRSPVLTKGVGEEMVELWAGLEGVVKDGRGVRGSMMSTDQFRATLSSLLPSQSSFSRSAPPAQTLFLLTLLRLETLRAEAGAISPFFEYLPLGGLFGGLELSAGGTGKIDALGEAVKSVGDKVLTVFLSGLSVKVTEHSLSPLIHQQIGQILLQTTHRSQRTRETALRYLDNILTSFPSLVCDLEVVTVMLELLTLLRRSCLSGFLDEYTPTYTYPSHLLPDLSLTLPSDYPLRNRLLRTLHSSVRAWLLSGITRSPSEVRALLMEYVGMAEEGYKAGMGGMGGGGGGVEEEMGKSVALEVGKMAGGGGRHAALPAWGNWEADSASSFARTFAAKSFFGGQAEGSLPYAQEVLSTLERLEEDVNHHNLPYKMSELRDLFYRGGAAVVKAEQPDHDLIHLLASLPIRLFTEASIAAGQEVWTWIADSRPELEVRMVAEVLEGWERCVETEQGLFSRALDPENPLNQETQYNPTDKSALNRDYLLANRVFAPMLALLEFLSSRFQAFRYRNKELVWACMRKVARCLEGYSRWSKHPLSRELRLRFLSFGFCILQGSRLESVEEYGFRAKLYDALLRWFNGRPLWSYGSNRIQLKSDLQAIDELLSTVSSDVPAFDKIASASDDRASSLPGRISIGSAKEHHRLRQQLVKALLNDEADRVRLWINPLQDSKRGPIMSGETPSAEELRKLARFAWQHWPSMVIFLPERFKAPPLALEVARLVRADPERVQSCPEALAYFVDGELTPETKAKLRHLLFWAPVPVPSALRFLHPKYGNDPILLQYALRVLEHHPVEVTFFYIPQVVQALRTDESGFAERFIFETSKISQHFCHQIIWNMKANGYRGDEADEPDPMKPTLDRMVNMIVESLSGDAKDFYQREFSFFDEVTSISGKLKPYIKASKPEKKAKIDEEMAKIKVDPGVYLPSNPDGVVVDINRTSGRPLQSHAKAPFMATFKVRRTRRKVDTDDLKAQDALIDVEHAENAQTEEYDTWQSAIFKVGDDCRQDVLALQIIAMHKNIFNALGLDLLVTPYRVTATGPGCGVIDVVPDATSRDEMGRAKINDLQSFFVMKHGPVDSVAFQRARTNFIQSMAAYSLLCYIVQIKDRHNGNIMLDGRGCITHIDFGFLFDIGPGGVKFEPNSFKLSHEMVVLMGGRDSVGFRQFRELTVKAFLSARYYAQAIVDTTSLMLAAEFPSFKGEGTIDRLKGRFKLDLSEKDAARFMVDIINDACENKRSIVYDEFQRQTNGIPYTR